MSNYAKVTIKLIARLPIGATDASVRATTERVLSSSSFWPGLVVERSHIDVEIVGENATPTKASDV